MTAGPVLIPPSVSHLTHPAPLPAGWSWRIYQGVLVIDYNDIPYGWVALSEHVPFTPDLANRIVRDLAQDVT